MIGFQLHRDLLNDYEAHKMPPDEFMRQFMAAVSGEQVYLSKFVRPWNGRPPADKWRKLRERVFKRDDYTCQYCGERGVRLECDHVVPVAKGGNHKLSNLKTACRPCNQSKRDKTLAEWRAA